MARKKECNNCGNDKEPNYMNDSLCRNCRSITNKEKRAKAREAKGLPPVGSGRSVFCSKCGEKKDAQHLNSGYCRKCASQRRKSETTKKRLSRGLQPWGSGKRKLLCCGCGKVKESTAGGYCFSCKNERERKRYLEKYNSEEAKAERRAAVNKKYQEDFVFRVKKIARQAVNDALKRGVIVRQPCIKCGSEKVDAHHDDYLKPLDVTWLCRRHHAELHKQSNKD